MLQVLRDCTSAVTTRYDKYAVTDLVMLDVLLCGLEPIGANIKEKTERKRETNTKTNPTEVEIGKHPGLEVVDLPFAF